MSLARHAAGHNDDIMRCLHCGAPVEPPADYCAEHRPPGPSDCGNCSGVEWVCENHEDRPWGGLSADPMACECGAGAPCPVCNREMACVPYLPSWRSISSAPVDGTEVLISGGTIEYSAETFPTARRFNGVAIARYNELSGEWDGGYGSEYDGTYWHKPAGWMPLPTPI